MAESTTAVERTDVEVEEAEENAEAVHFTTNEPVQIPIGESVGNEMYVEASQFVAMSVDGEQTVDPMTAMQNGISPDDERVVEVDDESGEMVLEVNEASIFVSNGNGEVGGGVLTVEETNIDGIISRFEDENL